MGDEHDAGDRHTDEELARVGLQLQETTGEGGAPEYLISGNTFANRALIKRHGGRWSGRRQCWVFTSDTPLKALAEDLPAERRHRRELGLLTVGDLDDVRLVALRGEVLTDHLAGRGQGTRVDHRDAAYA